jgi:hypothetical protein
VERLLSEIRDTLKAAKENIDDVTEVFIRELENFAEVYVKDEDGLAELIDLCKDYKYEIDIEIEKLI